MKGAVLIDHDRALGYLMRFLSVEGTPGKEARIGREIVTALLELGVPRESLRFDDAHKRIPLATETGNLIATVQGQGERPGRLFIAHRDTVELCAGCDPRIQGDRVVSASSTALGGDDRAGVACLVSTVAELKRRRLPHPPLTLLFTVREESGAWGARCLNPDSLSNFEMAFNFDGPSPAGFFTGAVGAAIWKAEVFGKAAHAGLHPEQGISAPLVVAVALAAAQRRGWWGKIRRNGREGTSNVGRVCGRDGGCVGGPANVVADYAAVEGEARSHDAAFIPRIVAAFRRSFHYALSKTRNQEGRQGRTSFQSETLYEPFRLSEDSPVVRLALDRSRAIGLTPAPRIANGGLDANWLVSRGLPTVTVGVGQRNVHTRDEYLYIPDFLSACELALALARS